MTDVTPAEYMKITAQEVHKPFRHRYPRAGVYFDHQNETFCMDLVDMSAFADKNDGAKWMLLIVDGFTRYAYGRALTSKEGGVVFSALEDILKEASHRRHNNGQGAVVVTPEDLYLDEGREFDNKWFRNWCKATGATMYHTHGEQKCSIIERFNRTLKTEMWRRFTEKNTRKWIDMLPELLSWYNHKKHSTLKMSPEEASLPANKAKVALRVSDPSGGKPPAIDNRVAAFKLGDKVRIARVRGIFEKKYLPGWSTEIFTVTTIIRPDNIDDPLMYGLTDWRGEEIRGGFYAQEMQKVSPKISDIRLVEKVLGRKTVKGVKMVHVKWLGIDARHSQWIPEENIVADLSKGTPATPIGVVTAAKQKKQDNGQQRQLVLSPLLVVTEANEQRVKLKRI